MGSDVIMQLDDVVASTTPDPKRVEEAMHRSLRYVSLLVLLRLTLSFPFSLCALVLLGLSREMQKSYDVIHLSVYTNIHSHTHAGGVRFLVILKAKPQRASRCRTFCGGNQAVRTAYMRRDLRAHVCSRREERERESCLVHRRLRKGVAYCGGVEEPRKDVQKISRGGAVMHLLTELYTQCDLSIPASHICFLYVAFSVGLFPSLSVDG